MAHSAQNVASVCKVMQDNVALGLKAFGHLRFTVLSKRPDNTKELTTLLNAIDEGVRVHAVAEKYLDNIQRECVAGSKRDDFRELGNMWEFLRPRLAYPRQKVTKAVKAMIMIEMLHITQFQEFFHDFEKNLNLQSSLTAEDLHKITPLIIFDKTLQMWMRMNTLFHNLAPKYMSPNVFFDSADGLYAFLSMFYELVLVRADDKSPAIVKLRLMIENMLNKLGSFFGPPSLLMFKNEREAIEWAKKFLGPKSVKTADKKRRVSYLSYVKIDANKLSPDSAKIASEIFKGKWVTLYSPYYDMQMYELILRRIVRAVKSSYTDMRRTILHILSLVFPVNDLLTKAEEPVAEVKKYFEECFDILKLCRKSIHQVRKDTSHTQIASYTWELHKKVFRSSQKLREECIPACKKAVRNTISEHYSRAKSSMHEATMAFIMVMSSKIAKTGFEPLELEWVYKGFTDTMAIYQGVMAVLQNLLQRPAADNTITIIHGVDQAEEILKGCFTRCYDAIKECKTKKARINVGFVLQRLPLTPELKTAIYKTNVIPFDQGPKTNKPVCPPPKVVDYLKTEDIDLNTLVVPEGDIISDAQFRQLLFETFLVNK